MAAVATNVALHPSSPPPEPERRSPIRVSQRVTATLLVVLVHAALLAALTWKPAASRHRNSEPALPVQIVEIAARQPERTIALPRIRPVSIKLPELKSPLVDTTLTADPVREPAPAAITPDPPPRPPLPEPTPARPATPSAYVALLAQRLAEVKRYPVTAKLHRDQGTVLLFFKLDHTGKLLAWHLAHSSGSSSLDTEVGEMVTAAAPYPAFPGSMQQASADFLVPIEFALK